MNEESRKQRESVLGVLSRLDHFSIDLALRSCETENSSVVSRTLRELVREGALVKTSTGGEDRYHWKNSPSGPPPSTQSIPNRRCGQKPVDDHTAQTVFARQPRERLLSEGAAALNDAELLSILIRIGVPKHSAILEGQRIAHRFAQRIEELAECTQRELREISPAATRVSYAQIMAGIELGRRITLMKSSRHANTQRITDTRTAIDYCRQRFARLAIDGRQEQFHIVTLDTKHKPIQTHCITIGTLDASLVHPREVFRPAIRDAASAILLVHNHPSGDPTPSRQDLGVTEQLTEAGRLLGIEVLDHIVVAGETGLSIRETTGG